jgi:transcriptional regulator with XRE-family HTH domain
MELGRELRVARMTAGMRLADVARPVGTSASQLSRIERGQVPTVGYTLAVRIGAAVGLNLSVKAYPGGHRLLDRPQLELFKRLREKASPTWLWETEVPMPIPGDLRAADSRARIPGCSLVVEIYSRLADFQSQSRAALLKKRDLKADRLILVVAGSSANRRALREAGEAITASFPLGTRAVLRAFAAGHDPGADGIVLL